MRCADRSASSLRNGRSDFDWLPMKLGDYFALSVEKRIERRAAQDPARWRLLGRVQNDGGDARRHRRDDQRQRGADQVDPCRSISTRWKARHASVPDRPRPSGLVTKELEQASTSRGAERPSSRSTRTRRPRRPSTRRASPDRHRPKATWHHSGDGKNLARLACSRRPEKSAIRFRLAGTTRRLSATSGLARSRLPMCQQAGPQGV